MNSNQSVFVRVFSPACDQTLNRLNPKPFFVGGAFLGPTLGGLLLEVVGARTAYSSTGILEVALAVVLFLIAMTPAFRRVNTARSPLLGSA